MAQERYLHCNRVACITVNIIILSNIIIFVYTGRTLEVECGKSGSLKETAKEVS